MVRRTCLELDQNTTAIKIYANAENQKISNLSRAGIAIKNKRATTNRLDMIPAYAGPKNFASLKFAKHVMIYTKGLTQIGWFALNVVDQSIVVPKYVKGVVKSANIAEH